MFHNRYLQLHNIHTAIVPKQQTFVLCASWFMIEKSKQTAIIEEAKNLYTDYMIKHASDDDFTDDVVIEIDGKYYAVKDGALILDTDGEKAQEYEDAAEAAETGLGDTDGHYVIVNNDKTISDITTAEETP